MHSHAAFLPSFASDVQSSRMQLLMGRTSGPMKPPRGGSAWWVDQLTLAWDMSSHLTMCRWIWDVQSWSWLPLPMDISFGPVPILTVSQVKTRQSGPPNDFVLILFCMYSPAHALIWIQVTSANWMLMIVVMVVISKQICSPKFIIYTHRLKTMT